MTDAAAAYDEVLRLISGLGLGRARVYFFGSRISGRARAGSDLDVAIEADKPLSLSDLSRIKEAFDESDLPFRVDVSDYTRLEPAFRKIALASSVVKPLI